MKYRPEIDGLRAFAVLPVILFHAGFSGFSGGFVGVDIFFVLSGYLITSILVGDIERGKFSIVTFYERRARRILPALIVMIAAAFPAAFLLMDPSAFNAFKQSVIATALFVSNIHFWRATDYFAAPAAVKPLLHTWSLAVEEQFYIVFPIILFVLSRRLPKLLVPALAVGFACSLALAQWVSYAKPSANFFLLPTRAFELLAGSLCVFALRPSATTLKPALSSWTSPLKGALTLAGLMAVIASVALYTEDTPFPSLYALLPVGGTALIILFAAPGMLAHRILTWKPFVAIGLISYSAYLWHQPLFAFARIWSVLPPPLWLMFLLAVLAFIIGALSWRFVEQPVRRPATAGGFPRRTIFASSGIALAALVAGGVMVSNTHFYNERLTDQQRYYESFLDYRKSRENADYVRAGYCFIYTATDNQHLDPSCVARSDSRPNYAIVGDSIPAHLWKGLSEAIPDINIMQATASGCEPVLPLEGTPWCTKILSDVFKEVIPNIDGIILGADWTWHGIARLPSTLQQLKRLGLDIIILGPAPKYLTDLPRLMSLSSGGNADMIRKFAFKNLDSDVLQKSIAISKISKNAGVTFIPLLTIVCQSDMCDVFSDDGSPLSYDVHHFTLQGARKVSHLIIVYKPFIEHKFYSTSGIH